MRGSSMDSGCNTVVHQSNDNNSEHTLMLNAFSDCIHAANLCDYQTSFFQPHRNVMKTYPTIFDNEELFKKFAEKVIFYTQSHAQQTRSSYARLTNNTTADDINKLEKEFIAKKHRISLLHFLVVILRIQINGEESLFKKFSCYDIYTRTLYILCNDASSLALNLSCLLIDNKAPETENTRYLNEIHALNKILTELWPIFRKMMIEQVIPSSEKTENFCNAFKKVSFWTCYKFVCLTKWQYVSISHKLGTAMVQENIQKAHQTADLFFKTDSQKIIQFLEMDKEQAEKEMAALKKEIENITKKGFEALTKIEDKHLSIYQHTLKCTEETSKLIFNISQIEQQNHDKTVINQTSFEKAVNWLPMLTDIVSLKNNQTLDNYKTTFIDVLELNNYLRPLELVQLLPHIIKINDIWLTYFKTTSCGLVSSLLIEKHRWLHEKFTEGLTQAERCEQNRHKKNINLFVRDFINTAKNILPEQSHSKEAVQLVDALMTLHQDIFDAKDAPIKIHEAFNLILQDLKKQAGQLSVQHMNQCKENNAPLYESYRYMMTYTMQRIYAYYLFSSCVLKHPKFMSLRLILETNLNFLFSEAFALANLLLMLALDQKVPTEKWDATFQKINSILFVENNHWKKHSTFIYQKLQTYSQDNQDTKIFLDSLKGVLWTQHIDVLLFKTRYARIKVMQKDKDSSQLVSDAQQQKIMFDKQKKCIATFCNITLEQQQNDEQKIIRAFEAIQPKVEKPIEKKKKIEPKLKTTTEPKIPQKTTCPSPKTSEQPKKPSTITNSAAQNQPITKKTNAQKTPVKNKAFKKPLDSQLSITEVVTQPLVKYPNIPSVSYDIYDFVELPVKLNNHVNTTTKKQKAKPKPKEQPIEQPVKQPTEKILSSTEKFIAQYKSHLTIQLCPDVKAVLAFLTQENDNTIAFVRGGYVRDKLYQRPVNDADIVTNLEPAKIIEKLENLGYSCKFATKLEDVVLITCRKNNENSLPIDISFSTLPLEQEAKKSDLTINSFICFQDGIVIDYFGAIDDLNSPELKMVSNDEEEFKTNPKKYLRNIRFSAEYQKNISDSALKLMHKHPHIISDLPYMVFIDHLKILFLTGYATEVYANLLKHNLFSIISTQLTSESIFQNQHLHIFLNWHFTQIDNDIKLDEKNKKKYKIEHILGLVLLPALIASPNLSTTEIVNTYISQHEKELAAEDRHMLITRIEKALLHYKELYSPCMPKNEICLDITNTYTTQEAITYQFSHLNINEKSESENDQFMTKYKIRKNV